MFTVAVFQWVRHRYMEGTVLVTFPNKICLIQLHSLGILLLKYTHVFSGVKRWTLHISTRHLLCFVRGCESTVYLCTLFNEAGNNEGHIASKGKDIDASRKEKQFGWNWSWSNDVLSCNLYKGTAKLDKTRCSDTSHIHRYAQWQVNFDKRQSVPLSAVLKLQFQTLYNESYTAREM
jgi:hypothetical protein